MARWLVLSTLLVAVAVAIHTGEDGLAEVGAASVASLEGGVKPTAAQVKAQKQQFPEDGGTMVKAQQAVGPNSAVHGEMDNHDASETGLANTSMTGFNQTDVDRAMNFTLTSASHRRAGYEEVSKYLDQLSKQPATGNGSSYGQALMQDPEMGPLMDSVNRSKSFIEKANVHMLHAAKMLELLKEDRTAVVNSAPFEAGKLQKMNINAQLLRLNKAIKHESLASAKWRRLRSRAANRLRTTKRKLKKLEYQFVKRDGKRRADWLKKLASEHVDFNLWRADHAGQESKSYLEWKMTKKAKQSETEAAQRLEKIRTRVESKLEQQTQQEFTAVQHAVTAAVNNSEAQGVMDSIDSLTMSEFNMDAKRGKAEDRAEENYHNLEDKVSRDVETLKRHVRKAKVRNDPSMKRVRLESEDKKVARLKGLIAAGVIRDKRRQGDLNANNEPVLDGQEQTIYDAEKAKGTTDEDRKADQKSLDERVEKAKKKLKDWDDKRAVLTEEIATRVTQDEHRDQQLSGLELRSYESKMKLDAMHKIKDLSMKLAAFKTKGASASEKSSESSSKQEIADLDMKVRFQKVQTVMADTANQQAKVEMERRTRKPRIVAAQDMAVLPGQSITAPKTSVELLAVEEMGER